MFQTRLQVYKYNLFSNWTYSQYLYFYNKMQQLPDVNNDYFMELF